MNENIKPKIIFVLGMHRSGTSLAAQLIAKWGAYMGDDLMPADTYNRDGYWEYNPLYKFHEKLLKKTNNWWFAPSVEINTPNLLFEFSDDARNLVEQMDKGGEIWCWKDPRLILFFDFWMKILEEREIMLVATSRDIDAIVQSLRYRDKFPDLLTISLWEYTSSMLFSRLKGKKYFFLNYELLIHEPGKTAGELYRFLDGSILKVQKEVSVPDSFHVVKKELDHSNLALSFQLSEHQKKLLSIYKNPYLVEDFIISPGEIQRLRAFFEMLAYLPKNFFKPFNSSIYYLDDSGSFNEQYTLVCNGLNNNPIFRFKKPYRKSTLRFDPLEDYVYIRLEQIQLFFKGEKADVTINITSNAFEVTGDHYLFDTPDPRIYINITGSDPISIDEIRISMEYIETGEKAILEALGRCRMINLAKDRENFQIGKEKQIILNAKERLEKQLINTENKLKTAGEAIFEYKKSIEQLKEILNKKQNEVDRYSGQLLKTREKLAVLQGKLIIKWVQYISRVMGKIAPVRILLDYTKRITDKIKIRRIRKSAFFDQEYYLMNNPDVKNSGIDPSEHFYKYGSLERRNPSRSFNTGYYLDTYPDVSASRLNPLYHYLKFGIREKRTPRPVLSEKEKTDLAE